ncbi:MAG: transporter [Pseudonocardiales bacterium]|nr:transporter [Pseudonocardiales bacterium]
MPPMRTALVTGATSGIGRAAAVSLARDGFKVLVHGRDARRGAAVVKEIESAGGGAEFHAADLADIRAIGELASAAEDVDVLVNNAGFSWFGPTAELDSDQYDELFDANVRSAYYLTAAIAPKMAEHGRGTIINLGSMAGQIGLAGASAYGATKAALASLTRSWAAEYSPRGVRVNTIAPGPVYTGGCSRDSLTALGKTTLLSRIAEAEETGDVIAFLASPAAGYITGAVIPFDGGRTAIWPAPGPHKTHLTTQRSRHMKQPVVLITGSLTGIGRAAAVAFAKKGAKLVVNGRRDEAGAALVEELRTYGAQAEFVNADVRKDEDVRAMVDQTVARFGRLDVAVNNAGTEGQVGPIVDQTAETFAATFDTNVLGVVLSMKHEVRVMQEQGSGSIINISSTYGHEGAAGASVYVGSKHAVEGITKSVALEVAKAGIRVNGVAPGPTDTGMLTRFTGTSENKAALVTQVPLDRLGLSEELADAIVFIASDEASYITGHILNVDGGHSAN